MQNTCTQCGHTQQIKLDCKPSNTPTSPGWYWYNGVEYQIPVVLQVYVRPGHSYLCVDGEPYGISQRRDFRAVARMSGQWSDKIPEPGT